MFRQINRCRICGNSELVLILNLGNQYLTGVFPKSRSEKLTCGPLELVKCHGNGCGLVQLRHSYDSTEMYGANYGYRSSLNRSMVDHLKLKVDELLSRFPVSPGDIVLDIGSNDGTLLSFYPENLERVGMDPTAAKFREFYKADIQVITDFFSAAGFRKLFGDKRAKIVTSIAMFYDLDNPLEFVQQIAEILDEGGIWHFEQSYLPSMLRTNAYDTVCHEHLEYYSFKQIQWMMEKCGLKVLNVELNDINGGSFAVTVCKSASSYHPNSSAIQNVMALETTGEFDTLRPYEDFNARVFKHRDRLIRLLDELLGKDAKILGYGASTKGNVILQFCGITRERIPFIAEVNKDKFGCVTPGTKIPIISEDEAHSMNPNYFLVLPWHFRDNLLKREESFLARGGKIIFPLPEIEIIGR